MINNIMFVNDFWNLLGMSGMVWGCVWMSLGGFAEDFGTKAGTCRGQFWGTLDDVWGRLAVRGFLGVVSEVFWTYL